MTIHTLIGPELIAFTEQMSNGQFIANLIHHPAGVYTAYVIDRTKPTELPLYENEDRRRMDGAN